MRECGDCHSQSAQTLDMAAAAPLAVAHDLHPMLHHFETVGPGKIVFQEFGLVKNQFKAFAALKTGNSIEIAFLFPVQHR
jgi:hypothetical protein